MDIQQILMIKCGNSYQKKKKKNPINTLFNSECIPPDLVQDMLLES